MDTDSPAQLVPNRRAIDAPALLMGLVLALLALLAVATGPARADDYPSKPIHIIVPYPAGGGNDIIARAIGQKLAERLGQPVVIDNKPGGSTLIGAEAAARAPADGHTPVHRHHRHHGHQSQPVQGHAL